MYIQFNWNERYLKKNGLSGVLSNVTFFNQKFVNDSFLCLHLTTRTNGSTGNDIISLK